MATPVYAFAVEGARQRYGSWLFGYWVDVANTVSIQATMQLAPGATP